MLDEDTAASDLRRLRIQFVVGAALSVGSVVAVTGAIGFVGLVAPHVMRPQVYYRPSRLLLASALAGASLTLAADIVVRLLPVSSELSPSMVTAIIGAPMSRCFANEPWRRSPAANACVSCSRGHLPSKRKRYSRMSRPPLLIRCIRSKRWNCCAGLRAGSAGEAGDMMDNACALPTSPQLQKPQTERLAA